MKKSILLLILGALLLVPGICSAAIHGLTGTTFDFTAKEGYISTPEGGSIYTWGYSDDAGMMMMQYPGPTLILNQGDTVTVNLSNNLPEAVSIVFPGQENVQATGGSAGILTREAPPGGSVSYTFTANNPGTYIYHSGTMPDVQVEMGLVGAIIVRPAGFNMMMPAAYAHADSMYTYEYLFLLTEMDPRIHKVVETEGAAALANYDYLSNYFPVYWFINGRCAPDTMAPHMADWLPHQPYDCMPMMHPGDKMLMRVVVAGRDMHPFHHHGNHARVIARDGRLLESAPGAGADLSPMVFTIQSVPGETVDAIFEWTGKGLGWDLYGHSPTDPLAPNEYAPDHGKPFPVVLPEQKDLTFGGMYSGSPFLGLLGALPPGEGGMNPNAGFTYMWHSHTEKEMVNNDIFPGGMMTMLMIVDSTVPISH